MHCVVCIGANISTTTIAPVEKKIVIKAEGFEASESVASMARWIFSTTFPLGQARRTLVNHGADRQYQELPQPFIQSWMTARKSF